jgi:hypothetical protein
MHHGEKNNLFLLYVIRWKKVVCSTASYKFDHYKHRLYTASEIIRTENKRISMAVLGVSTTVLLKVTFAWNAILSNYMSVS